MTVGRIPNIEGGIQPTLLTTTGDIMYASSASNPARLGIGSSAQVLTVAAGVPSWSTLPASIPANATATVSTEQGTTSATYTDLATSGPAVTVTTGTKAMVIVTSWIDNNGDAGEAGYMGYAVSGATTVAATDDTALYHRVWGSSEIRASAASVVTLTAGSNTFTAKYRRATGGTSSFKQRSIIVINLA